MRELEEDGMGYWFVSREEMEHDTRDHQFLECGEHNGHLYGTKLDTIRTIIRQGKMCVLDCSPNVIINFQIRINGTKFERVFISFVLSLGFENSSQLSRVYAIRYFPSSTWYGAFKGNLCKRKIFQSELDGKLHHTRCPAVIFPNHSLITSLYSFQPKLFCLFVV